MNKLIYTLLIFVVSSNLIAQKFYHEWAPIGAEWYYSDPDLNSGNPWWDYDRIVSTKDTVIEGKNCRIVIGKKSTEIFYQENGKIFYFFNKTFHLIYDFEVSLKDTIEFQIKGYPENSFEMDTVYPVKCIVEKIDTLVINNINHLKIYTSTIPNESFSHLIDQTAYNYIEKIGYAYAFLYHLKLPSPTDITFLRCYNDDNINYKSPWFEYYDRPCDDSYLNSYNEIELNNDFYLYPNPVKTNLFIENTTTDLTSNYNIYIFDLMGTQVKYEEISADCYEIDTSCLPFGTYVIHVYNKQKLVLKQKILKL